MPVFRWIMLLLLVAALVCFGLYIGTGEARWRVRGIRVVKWTVAAALAFFAVLIAERVVK